ncbi:MaoC family dehydratase [Rhodococcus sp. IEGM 1379]|uniref:MaoC family dehydratase n=1 Tax=Rhodococcus sp. IEGM 1379 TaxID=3047086 RepID=UPI0024B6ECAC|nr:MaoC family dehydratase [Rhodococcus sp. IEGM 1379]MDI9914121.1 MaoC family dehydratase [Rhodococcus sp. IEGM 1379]
MRIFSGIDEVESAVGEHLGYSEWFPITQERVDKFADATEDHQWIHVDPERAAQGPYGGTIAHGYLTLSLLPVLGAQVMRVDGVSMAVNYGSNKVRFPAPVKVGSSVRAGAEILTFERTTNGANLVVRYTIEIEGVSKPALVADTVRLLVA